MSTIRTKSNLLTVQRIKNGMSMNDLAKVAGANVGVISRIEKGLVNPRPKTVNKICKALNVEFDELFEIVERVGA